jgi:hypothetical protein
MHPDDCPPLHAEDFLLGGFVPAQLKSNLEAFFHNLELVTN